MKNIAGAGMICAQQHPGVKPFYMKIEIDIKSMLIGFLGAALLVSVVSFRGAEEQKSGKFQTVVSEKAVVILDTETGAYIIAPEIRDFGQVQWVKGDFYKTYQVGRDNKKGDGK